MFLSSRHIRYFFCCSYIHLLNCHFLVVQDENRYNAGRGAHLTLKRAEKARALVNKLPGIHCIMWVGIWYKDNLIEANITEPC